MPGTRLHLSELEAFEAGTVPDDAGGATFGGLSTSTNDIGDGTLVTYGSGNLFPTVGTTDSIQHGAPNENPNNILENAGNVWSTNLNLATNTQYTLDLGGTFDVTTLRMWPRADGCCTERWQNLQVNLYADDGAGAPGALIASSDDARLTAPGGNVPLELTFNAGSTDIDEITFTPALTHPGSAPAVLSSAAPDTLVGNVAALSEFGTVIDSATYELVAGAGGENNALYEIDGTDEIRVIGDLSGLDGVVHSVLVRATTDEGFLDAPFTFTVLLDSDSDGLVDSWELMFGALGDFATGGDADGDGDLDEEEFDLGTDPSVSHGALFFETFQIDNGGFTQEALGNTPVDAVHSAELTTWSMAGDGSGPSTNYLTSPMVTVPVTGGIQVSFDHRYSIEPDWDGAALQVSVDGGPFRTVGASEFTVEGYSNLVPLIGNHLLRNGDGFNGDSLDYASGSFVTSIADLGGFAAGSTVTVRFLGAWDEGAIGAGTPNWEIDSVRLVLLPDSDGDGMHDDYEEANGLNESDNDAAGDPDTDTVSNLDEYLARTDPNNDDTDSDDLTDDLEVTNGTDPLVADTDGDGRSDGEEVNDAPTTDPTDADSDDDGVDDGTEVAQGYDPNDPNDTPSLWTVRNATSSVALNSIAGARALFEPGGPIVNETTTQHTTINFRQNAFGPFPDPDPFPVIGSQNDPVSPPTDPNDFAVLATGTIVIDEGGTYTFGFNSDDGGGLFIDGNPVAVFDANRGSATTVGVVNLDEGLHDMEFIYWERSGGAQVQLFIANDIGDQTALAVDNASVVANFHLLETSSFPRDDSDGDGLPDAYEESLFPGDLTQLGAEPADFDGDTLTDIEEFNLGTNPTLVDTDGDGLTDDVETNTGTFVDASDTGTDPRESDTDGDSISDGVEVAGTNGFVTIPTNPDTDGDSFDDGIEVSAGSDPTDAESLPPVTLLAYYDFNGELVDRADNSPDLMLNGAAALTTTGMGVTGSAGDEALDLMGLGDSSYGSTPIGGHLDLASTNNSISVSFWQFNTQLGATTSFWLTAPLADGTQRGFQAHAPWSNGTTFFDQSGCCDAPERLTVAGVHVLNQWQHFVFQRNTNGDREIWVDGVMVASAGGGDPLDPFDGGINIGGTQTGGNSFAGRIDDFAIFSDSLSPDQIGELANGATALDLLGPAIPFVITTVSRNLATGETTIEWNSQPNQTYAVDASESLDAGLWGELDDGVPSGGETTSFTDTSGAAAQFYRVRVIE